MNAKALVEVDKRTLIALEAVTEMTALATPREAPIADDIAELDRRWAAIEAGEPTVSNDAIVRWLRTWGSPTFKSRHDR